jgi:hypothetical protein
MQSLFTQQWRKRPNRTDKNRLHWRAMIMNSGSSRSYWLELKQAKQVLWQLTADSPSGQASFETFRKHRRHLWNTSVAYVGKR